VFGAQSNDMGGTLVRSIGLMRAKARIGLKNLAYKQAPPGATGAPHAGGSDVTVFRGEIYLELGTDKAIGPLAGRKSSKPGH
jgi:hypothetical protein